MEMTTQFPAPPQPVNPLAAAEKMQTLEAQSIQNEQNMLAIKAQKALGPLMQQSLDPATGQPDLNKFIGLVASHPDAAYLAPKIMQDALAKQLTQEETLGKHLDNMSKKFEFTRQVLAPLVEKGKGVSLQDAAGALAQLGPRGFGVLSETEMLHTLSALGSQKMPLDQIIRQAAMQTDRGQKTLDGVRGTWAERNALVEVVSPSGGKMKVPRYQLDSDSAPGGSAPLPSEADRQGMAPSSPSSPAALSGVQSEPSAGEKHYAEKQVEEFSALETDINKTARFARAQQQRIEETFNVLKDFKSGPGMGPRKKAAELAEALGRQDLAEALLGAPGNKEAISAMQAFEKMAVVSAVEVLKSALGGGNRITNMEVEQFFKANPNMETDPKAIEKMLNFISHINDLARHEAKALEHYKKSGKMDPLEFQNAWTDYLVKTGKLKFGPFVAKQPGGK